MRLFSKKLAILPLMLLQSATVLAQNWGPDDLDTLTEQFVQTVPNEIKVRRHGWTFYTLEKCFELDLSLCWGVNPDTPYGVPIFENGHSVTQVREDSAIVFIIRTAPDVRYFSFLPYLHTRTDVNGSSTLFASLGEPLNNLKIVTAASTIPGDQVFNQLSVAVMTSDLNMYDQVKAVFNSIGFPTEAVQLLALSPELVRLGVGEYSDSFTLLNRIALPEDAVGFDDYINTQRPIRVVRLTPLTPQVPRDVPKPVLTQPGSGPEPAQLGEAQNKLIRDIRLHYQRDDLVATKSVFWTPIGEDCINNLELCGADAYDAVYTKEAANLANNPVGSNFAIVTGINHVLLNKALYINHAIAEGERHAGVASFTDKDMVGSAAYHAGITNPLDERMNDYRFLYAYIVTSDCNGLEYCLEVPQATVPGEVGIEPNGLYDIIGRIYVDPNTTVRPEVTELMLPWTLRPR